MKNEKKMNDKGFSLVELIIVIAIMAVLVGVLAPQFMKYVEQSRKATDIQNAEMIRDSVLADIADGFIKGSNTNVDFVNYNATTPAADGSMASAIATAPAIQGNLVDHGGAFQVTYDAAAGICSVSVSNGTVTYTLTDAASAAFYKTDTTPTTH